MDKDFWKEKKPKRAHRKKVKEVVLNTALNLERVGEVVDEVYGYEKQDREGKYDWTALRIEFFKRGDDINARGFISERFSLSPTSGFVGAKTRGWDKERKLIRQKALYQAKRNIIQSLMLTKEELLEAKDKTLRRIIQHLEREHIDLKELTLIYDNLKEELGEGSGAVDMIINFVTSEGKVIDGNQPRDIAETTGSITSLI